MSPDESFGWVVILNGAPRAGKSSIARAIAAESDQAWVNIGVDSTLQNQTPAHLLPGIGLRPGGERPDLEPYLPAMFRAIYESVAAQSRRGVNVVVDVGHHDSYTRPLGTLAIAAECLAGLPVLFVGVRCSIEEIMRRRNQGDGKQYVTGSETEPPEPVKRWQAEVHRPGIYDLEVDTSKLSAEDCAERILRRLTSGPHQALWNAAGTSGGA